ncbi:hypothetical protein [uncultured Phenylobacterium sp.]|uniref:hypothetical protein n=1 Tax=uncultured Phenylobacterium sp. TaxID=349273 RepID=UPI0025D70B54|nr:hypothetical protein [uncultured Phenylobacterium sp.]
MSRWRLGALAAILLLAAPAAQGGEPYRAPRTAYGQPDLQGVWNTHFVLPLEAPATGAPPLVLPEAEAMAYAQRLGADVRTFKALEQDPEVQELSHASARVGLGVVNGQRRTRQIVQPADGRLPVTPRARGMMAMIERVLRNSTEAPFPTDGPEQRPNWERCVVGQGQPPIAVVTEINPRQILQTRDAVVILSEYGPDLRIIPFAAKASHDVAQASPLGDAFARWEGETLVIETTRLPQRDAIRPFPTLLVSAAATVIERYTRVSEKELLYQYTVVDPAIYTAPWLAEYTLARASQPLYEFACHEGNYSLPNILAGARQLDRERAAKP